MSEFPFQLRQIACVLFACVLAACSGPSEERSAEKDLKAALDRLRDSTHGDPSMRRVHLQAVGQIQAKTAIARDAQDACMSAYTSLFDAEDAADRAEMQLRISKAGYSRPSEEALRAVMDADRLLQEAKAAMPACDAAAAKLAATAR